MHPTVLGLLKILGAFLTCQLLRKSKFIMKYGICHLWMFMTFRELWRQCPFPILYLGLLSCPHTHLIPTGSSLEPMCSAWSLSVLSNSAVGSHCFLPITLTAGLGCSFFLECLWEVCFISSPLRSPLSNRKQIKLRRTEGKGMQFIYPQHSLVSYIIMAAWAYITMLHLFNIYAVPSTLQSAFYVLCNII